MQILGKDPRTVAGGGGVELEVAKQLSEFGKKETGLDQYAIAKYAEALEVCQPSVHLPLVVSLAESGNLAQPGLLDCFRLLTASYFATTAIEKPKETMLSELYPVSA